MIFFPSRLAKRSLRRKKEEEGRRKKKECGN
jgi:hypothetical protein